MPRFPLPRQDCFDTNGNPRAGAKLYFYTTGTTTPLATYSNSGLSVANANPVVADSAGLFGEIFLSTAVAYKVVLKTSADVTVWTADPVTAGTASTDLAGLVNAAAITNTVSEQQAITNKLQFLQAGAGSVARSVQSKLRDGAVSVTDFGAVGDGSTDDLVAFRAAVATGKDVYIPDGAWRLSAAVTITTAGQQIIGSGGKCLIQTTSDITDIFTVGDGVGTIRNVLFRDFRMFSTVVKTAGAAIRFRLAEWCSVENVQVSSIDDFQTVGVRLWDGLVFAGVNGCRVTGCDMWGFGQDAIRVYASGTFNAELTISNNCWIAYAERYGVYCGGGYGGLHLESTSVSACWRNVCFDKVMTGTANRELFITQASLDASSDVNLWIGEEAASFVECTGMWCASAGRTAGVGPSSAYGSGIHVDPNNDNLTLRWTGGRLFNCAGAGIEMNEGRLLISDVLVTNNGTGTGFSDHGIWVIAAAGNSGPLQVTDCYFEGNAGYDLLVEDQLVYSKIVDNVFRGGGSGTYSSAANSASSTNIIQRNIGYVTRNEGSGAILAGNTTVTITHGLVGLPSNILLTALTTIPEGRGLAVSNITLTTFDVIISAAAVADRSFYWAATYGKYI
jgi:hypothetical protein